MTLPVLVTVLAALCLLCCVATAAHDDRFPALDILQQIDCSAPNASPLCHALAEGEDLQGRQDAIKTAAEGTHDMLEKLAELEAKPETLPSNDRPEGCEVPLALSLRAADFDDEMKTFTEQYVATVHEFNEAVHRYASIAVRADEMMRQAEDFKKRQAELEADYRLMLKLTGCERLK